jgi:endonuclease YncB( thermonuclease family)
MFSRFITCFKNDIKNDNPGVVVKEVPIPMVINDKVNDKVIPTWKNTTPFVAPVSEGHVIKVYDGDTITIAGYLPYPESPLYRFSVRLNGIDTPEMKGKTEKEKACAILAKTELQNLILDKRVVLRNVQTEKYGRLLAEVYIGDLHVNQHMLDTGMAVKYDGGTKTEFK